MPLADFNAMVAQLKGEMGYLTQKQQRETGRKSGATLAQVRAAARKALGMGAKKASPRKASPSPRKAGHKKHFVPSTRDMAVGRGYTAYCHAYDNAKECRVSPGCQWKGGKTKKCVKGWGKAKASQQVRASGAANLLQRRFRSRRADALARSDDAGVAAAVAARSAAAAAAAADDYGAGAGAGAGAGSDQDGGYWW